MLAQVLYGCFMIVLTMLCHALLTGYTLAAVKRRYAVHGGPKTDFMAALAVALFVLWLCAVTILSILAWVVLLLQLNVFPAFDETFYFSMVTMTTVGYGDVVVGKEWRVLAGFQAINGSFLFGWSTALVLFLAPVRGTVDRVTIGNCWKDMQLVVGGVQITPAQVVEVAGS